MPYRLLIEQIAIFHAYDLALLPHFAVSLGSMGIERGEVGRGEAVAVRLLEFQPSPGYESRTRAL